METVGSTKLKNSLNRYLVRIRKGARFIITDRGQPVAKLIPIADEGEETVSATIAALINEGLISIDSGIEDATLGDQEPVVNLKGSVASDAIVEDRRRG
jgi:prevent-host-death family protein